MKQDFNTFEQLVDRAETNHNITSYDVVTATTLLKEHSYYTLVNGYQRALESETNSELFKSGFSIEKLGILQINESLLSSNLLWLIFSVEKHFKTLLQNQVSEVIGVDQNIYLMPKKYSGNNFSEKNKVINHLKTIATGYSRGIHDKPVHHENVSPSLLKYRKEGNVPPWILVNDLNLGESLRWFKILSPVQKRSIVADFNINLGGEEDSIEFFSMSLDLIRQYRNGLAHGDIINKIHSTTDLNIEHLEKLFPNKSIISRPEYVNNKIGRSDLYGLLLSLVALSSELHLLLFKADFLNRISTIQSLLGTDSASFRRVLNVPDNLVSRLNLLIPQTKEQA